MAHKAKINRLFIIFSMLLLNLLLNRPVYSYDNAHFYRAQLFPGETRFERNYLSSFDITLAGGITNKGYACGNCEETCLLNICGCHNMQFLGKNVPNKDLSKPTDLILHQLAQIPARNNFAKLLFTGEFKILELVFSYYQNFTRGLFLHLHIPIRKLNVDCVSYREAPCPTDETCPNSCCVPNLSRGCPLHDPHTLWQAFLNTFGDILREHNINIGNTEQKGVGDFSIALGYTVNYEDTEVLDFIDATIRGGVMLPTSNIRNVDCVFSLPLGYDGHTGLFGALDVGLGIYDWATLGAHISATCFNSRRRRMRLKTAWRQTGFIKLYKDFVRRKKGNIYNVTGYFKFDHFVGGASFLFGYSYSTKHKDTLDCIPECISCEIANSACELMQWKMHTLQLLFEYDFTKEDMKYGPRFNLFYNHVISGERIFKTGMAGLGVGLDITWN